MFNVVCERSIICLGVILKPFAELPDAWRELKRRPRFT
jgi:hypothetical protein